MGILVAPILLLYFALVGFVFVELVHGNSNGKVLLALLGVFGHYSRRRDPLFLDPLGQPRGDDTSCRV